MIQIEYRLFLKMDKKLKIILVLKKLMKKRIKTERVFVVFVVSERIQSNFTETMIYYSSKS